MYREGDQVGGYEVLGVLGAGGMGQVYRVRNIISDRIDAMKVMLADLESEPGVMERFLREIKVHARLNHPNIAALHTAFEADGRLVMVLELMEGESLSELLRRTRLPLEAALDYAAQALAALAYAHGHGVIHRDIKPGNMFVTTAGVLKLMDFGIARAVSEKTLTAQGALLGSLHYMSPEQVRGEPIGERSDLYSLGIVLYEMVTGRRPFEGNSEFSIMRAHLETFPEPPSRVESRVPEQLSDVVLRALEKDPRGRFPSAEEFRQAIEAVRAEAAPAVREATPPPPPAQPPEEPATPPPPRPVEAPPIGPRHTTRGSGAPQRPVAAGRPMSRGAAPPAPRPAPHGEPSPRASRGLLYMMGGAFAILLIAAAATLVPRWTADEGETAAAVLPESLSQPGGPEIVEPPPPAAPKAEARSTPGARQPSQPVQQRQPPTPTPTPPPKRPAPQESAARETTPAPSEPVTEPEPAAEPAAGQPPVAAEQPPARETVAREDSSPPEPAPPARKNPLDARADPPVSPAPAPPPDPEPPPPGPGPGRVYRLSEVDQPPQNVHRVPASYTAEALEKGVQGAVRLSAEIWPDGQAHNIQVVKSVGDAGLDRNAVQALSQWRFAPATIDGKPVKCLAVVELAFRLEGGRRRPGLQN